MQWNNFYVEMKYPVGIQNFESLIKDGYAYVDKTEFVYKLVSEGRYYFLSRPRRFSKEKKGKKDEKDDFDNGCNV